MYLNHTQYYFSLCIHIWAINDSASCPVPVLYGFDIHSLMCIAHFVLFAQVNDTVLFQLAHVKSVSRLALISTVENIKITTSFCIVVHYFTKVVVFISNCIW